jgi:hypothetical protein
MINAISELPHNTISELSHNTIMQLTLQQHGTTVKIKTEGDCQTCDTMAQFCRELLLAQGYHPNSVTESLPTEEDVMEMISDALNYEKEVDRGCEVFDTLP